MIYAEDDHLTHDASISQEDDNFQKNPNALLSVIQRVVAASTPSSPQRDENSPLFWQQGSSPSRQNSSVDSKGSASLSLPTSPAAGIPQLISEREAGYLARSYKSDEQSCQAIAFARQLLLPHLNSYPVHRRIMLLSDITSGCKDFCRLEHELPFAILETVNDAFDSTSVVALSPSLGLLSQALRYNTKAFALSGAFPLLGLTLAKLFLIFKDAKIFEQLVEISDMVVKRWILADMKENLMPFLQSFIAACGRFWPNAPPSTAQQLMRTLIESCHSIVSVLALFDCAQGQICVGDDPSFAVVGAIYTVRHILMEMANNKSPTAEISRNDTVSYRRKLISDSALPLVSNLITSNPNICKMPKIFVEVVELLTVVANSQCPPPKMTCEYYSDFWIVMLNCAENLDAAIVDLSTSGSISPALRTQAGSLPPPVHTEPIVKYNLLLLALIRNLEEDSPQFATLYRILANSSVSPAFRSLDLLSRLCSYFCEHRILVAPLSAPIFIDIKRFLSAFYMREQRQVVRECILAGLSNAFIRRPEIISEMVVTVVIETIFPPISGSSNKTRSLISDTSSSKSAQAALSFIKQLFHSTRPARNRHFFITQALNVFFTASTGSNGSFIEVMSLDIFGLIVANVSDSLTCTAPVLMTSIVTIGNELYRRFDSSPSTLEVITNWRPTLLRFLCICSALDTNSLGLVLADRQFIESTCMFQKLEDLLELLHSWSNLVLNSDRKDMVLIPGLKWTAELSVPVVSLKLLKMALTHEKDPVSFKCLAAITGRFFSKRRILQHYASHGILVLVNEITELLCRCAATSIKRHMAEQSQLRPQPKTSDSSNPSGSGLTSSPQVPSQNSQQPSPYCLHAIFRTFLLVPPLDFAIDEDRRCMFFRILLKAFKSPTPGEAMDCLTLCLAHMSPKNSEEWIERVTVDLSKLISLELFAPNVILLTDTLRVFIKRSAITINQNTFLAIFSIVLPFANPARFGYAYSSLAFNSMFAWFLDSPVHLRPDLGSYVLKQLAISCGQLSSESSKKAAYYDEMTELARDVVTEHNSRRSNDFQPSRLVEFEGTPTWFLDNDRIISFKKPPKDDGSVSMLVRSPSSVSIFSLQRTTRRHQQPAETNEQDEDSFENDACALVATFFGSSTALLLKKPNTQEAERGLKNFDLILPFQNFKVGILFCGPGQTSEEAILSNYHGTPRYERFVERLGQVTRLVCSSKRNEANDQFLYTGGLDSGGEDGPVSLTYADDYCHVAYHVATLMPNHASDHKRNRKKRHIGNDYVIVIYNASGSTTQQRDGVASVISGSFAVATILITPLLDGNNLVQLFGKHNVPKNLNWNHGKAMIVPENLLTDFVRLLGIHCEITARCTSDSDAVAFNWLERLRHVRRLRGKLSQMNNSVSEVNAPEVVYQ